MAVGAFLAAVIRTRGFGSQFRFYKTTMTSLLVPPATVRGMTRLDRTAFTTVVEVPYLKLRDNAISKVMPVLKKYFLKLKNLKPVQNTSEGTVVYLNPALVKDLEDITENDRNLLSAQFEQFGKEAITLKYDNWRCEEILKSILPDGIEVPTSYSLVGHIVHLNLRDVHLPYKNIIGQIFLDNVSAARTVVNKTNTIDTTFRHFTMEILAGDKDTVATVKEFGYTYQFDFAQVYWNPRLSTEHSNLIMFMKRGDALYDVFAGVGPFAIPAARKGINVLANDLNPESYKWLQKNSVNNKVKNNFKAYNMDGRDFLRNVVKPDILNRRGANEPGTEHIAMNLPAMAVEFLDVFFNWFNKEQVKKVCSKPPVIHVYCFAKAASREVACRVGKLMVEDKIGCSLSSDTLISLHHVRNVSPNKEMIRVSFLLTESVLKGEEPATKRLKLTDDTTVFANDKIAENDGKEQGCTKEPKEQECIQSCDRT